MIKKTVLILLCLLLLFSGCDGSGNPAGTDRPGEHQGDEAEQGIRHFERFGLVSDMITMGQLRSEPSENAPILARYYANTGFEILGEEGDYYLVESEGIKGYIPKGLILTGEEAVRQCCRYGNCRAVVSYNETPVYLFAEADSQILFRIQKGAIARVLSDLDDYYEVNTEYGKGFLMKEDAVPGFIVGQPDNWDNVSGLDEPARSAVAWGIGYLGLAYRYGGESMTTGCDCSYFTGMCLYQTGNRMPRTSLEQSWEGVEITDGKWEPCDLLFYSLHGTEIDHVALYIGDGKILHASESFGCVCISDYNYCGEPMMVRRILR